MLFFLLLIQCNCSEWFWRPDQFMPIWRRHIQALSNFTMDWSSVWSLDYSIWCLEFWHSLLWYLFWNCLCCVWFKLWQPVLGSHAAKAVAFLLLVLMVSLKFKVRWTISWNISLYALRLWCLYESLSLDVVCISKNLSRSWFGSYFDA